MRYVREHPIAWTVPTHILYGENDNLTSYETISEFANQVKSTLTVMKNGEYQKAISVLYAMAYTLKMSYKTDYRIDGFFEYVVPPLEGFWWQDNIDGVNYSDKSSFNWISVIRLPDFVTEKDFKWAVETAEKKKKPDCSSAEFLTVDEGLCVQIMHIGAFDDEPKTVAVIDKFLEDNGYENDMNDKRLHHEIYMSDARKVSPKKWKTNRLFLNVKVCYNAKYKEYM